MKRFLGFILPLLLVIVLWETASRTGMVPRALFPPPSSVLAALWDMILNKTIFLDLYESGWRLATGLMIGAFTGISLGILTGRLPWIDRGLTPIIQALRPLPPVAIIPLVIVWFGIDNGAKIFSIAFAVFFPIWISTHIGAKQIPKIFLWSASLLTASKWKTMRHIIFPASLPFIITGIRTAIAVAFVMVFVSELSGASSGLGYRISIASLSYRMDQMIAALFILGALGAVTDHLFVFATQKLFPWLRAST